MSEMKNINRKPTIVLDKNDLNIIIHCPKCNASNDRIIFQGKKWKCLECHKAFKTPKIVGRNTNNIENIKTFKTPQNLKCTSVTVDQNEPIPSSIEEIKEIHLVKEEISEAPKIEKKKIIIKKK